MPKEIKDWIYILYRKRLRIARKKEANHSKNSIKKKFFLIIQLNHLYKHKSREKVLSIMETEKKEKKNWKKILVILKQRQMKIMNIKKQNQKQKHQQQTINPHPHIQTQQLSLRVEC